MTAIRQHLQADREKLTKIRALLVSQEQLIVPPLQIIICISFWWILQARKNREIALLQRKIDEVPSRTELAQYQRRFIELYNQGKK